MEFNLAYQAFFDTQSTIGTSDDMSTRCEEHIPSLIGTDHAVLGTFGIKPEEGTAGHDSTSTTETQAGKSIKMSISIM